VWDNEHQQNRRVADYRLPHLDFHVRMRFLTLMSGKTLVFTVFDIGTLVFNVV
jgi:hypothetical protein